MTLLAAGHSLLIRVMMIAGRSGVRLARRHDAEVGFSAPVESLIQRAAQC
jgi:hypothetical protein